MSTKRDVRKQKRSVLKKKRRTEKRKALKLQKGHWEESLGPFGPSLPATREDDLVDLLDSEEHERELPREGVLRLTSLEITDEPLKDDSSKNIPDDVTDRLEELYYLSQENPQKAIEPLQELRQQYPDIPRIYNYLTVAYYKTGQLDKAREMVIEGYRRFPDYLFARLNYAEICMRDGNYDAVSEIFDGKFDLTLLYPKRKKFHVSEVTSFYGIIGKYWLDTGEIDAAKMAYKMLKQISPQHPVTKMLGDQLFLKRLSGFFGKLGKGKAPKESGEED